MISLLSFFIFTGCALIGAADTGFDFDGDNRADLSVFRPETGIWYVSNSSGGYSAFRFGQDGDLPVAQDYDGDGKADAAVYRAGVWYRLKSATNTWDVIQFGLSDDVPSPADFDGDRKCDIAVFRPSTGQWHRLLSSNNSYSVVSFGQDGDVPVAADFDGDSRADVAVFRPQNGTWHQLNSATGNSYLVRQYGSDGDVPLTGDFDGDRKSDLAVWRPSDCNWYVQGSSGSSSIVHFGIPTDSPVPADYDGDGRSDISVFRPSGGYWYGINSATSTVHVEQFGLSIDIPVPDLRRGPRHQSPAPTPTPSATPTATPTPAPTPTATPVPTPTPAPPSFTCDYYASPTGTSSGTGSSSAPWDLQTGLGRTNTVVAGKTLCLRGGTYNGKFRTRLFGATVRSAPGEWAVIDGYVQTTLTASINSTQTSFQLANGSKFVFAPGFEGYTGIFIDKENIQVYSLTGNTVTTSSRGAGGSLGGATSHLTGATVVMNGSTFWVEGSGTTYRDFEITNSLPLRDGSISPESSRGNGVHVVNGTGNKFINLVIHDSESGLFTSNTTSNTEVYGCLLYNNGLFRNGAGLGHGMYLENVAGYSRIYDNIVLNNFNLGTQLFGMTASYVGGDIKGNVFANSGSPLGRFDPEQRNLNLLVGTNTQRIPNINVESNYFYQPDSSNGGSLKFGYGAGVDDGTIRGNYFVGGAGLMGVENTSHVTVTENRFYSNRGWVQYTSVAQNSSYTWNNNTYFQVGNRYLYGIEGIGIYQLPSWRAQTNFDVNSTTTNTIMPDAAIVRPSAYQLGRGNIIVYSPSRSAYVDVNLSALGLASGQAFTVKSAFNYGGSPVFTGNFNTSSPVVRIPLTGPAVQVAQPIGYDYTPPTTTPDFAVFVVVPSA